MEYALTLPHSRMGLLVRLAAPRLLVLALLFLAAWTATGMANIKATVLPYPALALVFGLPLFLVALSLSVLIDNFIALCLASLVGWYAFSSRSCGLSRLRVPLQRRRLPNLFAYLRPDAPTYRSDLAWPLLLLLLILPVVPFLAALLLSFGRFDMRRSARFKRRYGLVFAASLAFCVWRPSAAGPPPIPWPRSRSI